MEEPEQKGEVPTKINLDYVAVQWLKALKTEAQAESQNSQQQAHEKAQQWFTLIQDIVSQRVIPGRRQPTAWPVWVTLKVLHGGFATNHALASGPLQAHERYCLKQLSLPYLQQAKKGRIALNDYFLTTQGMAQLSRCLETCQYTLDLPEEGALLVVVALLKAGQDKAAQTLLAELQPYFAHLRFYPRPRKIPQYFGPALALQNVQETAAQLSNVKAQTGILAQREAVGVWGPLYDALLSLWLETVKGPRPALATEDCRPDAQGRWPVIGGWPCQFYPGDWNERAQKLLYELEQAYRNAALCQKVRKKGQAFFTLYSALKKQLHDPQSLSGKEVGRIRLILARSLHKHGMPAALKRENWRKQQQQDVAAPLYVEIAQQICQRLEAYPQEDALEDLEALLAPLPAANFKTAGANQVNIPVVLQAKVRRLQRAEPEKLLQEGLISSAEQLAALISQKTAYEVAKLMPGADLQYLCAQLFLSFRRRRSVLLFNLKHQVRWQELPWVEALLQLAGSASRQTWQKDLAFSSLQDLLQWALRFFPASILPNPLLHELRALAKQAHLELPLLEELAADIFTGHLTPKFVKAVQYSAQLLQNSLYSRYYAIDWRKIQALKARGGSQELLRLCERRAETQFQWGYPANSGRILEQLQILSTQNLATVVIQAQLSEHLSPYYADMSRQCLKRVVGYLNIREHNKHSALIHRKKAASAWRNMLFYLSLIKAESQWHWYREAEQELKNSHSLLLTTQFEALRACLKDPDFRPAQPFYGWTLASS